MGSLFGGDPGDGAKKAASALQGQRAKIEEALAAYNTRSSPFFGLEQNRGEFGQSFFPDLQERIRNPTLSPTFKLYADEGLRNLREGFSATGSPSAGRAQIAGGRFLEGLAAHQLDRSDQMLMGAVNQRGQLPVTQEPAYLGMNANLTQGVAQAQSADAQKTNFGGLFGGLIGLGSQFLPSMPKNPFGGQVADVGWSGYGQ